MTAGVGEARRARVAAIVGPTGVGKSALAVEVAAALGAEIVSVDSMQTYVGMDIGTDKATPEMRARVPHHMLDLWPPAHEVTVAEFQRCARAAIDDIAARGALPLLVGGSGLYFRAVVDDLDFPPRAPEVRAALEAEADLAGPAPLYERLEVLDPEAAHKIDAANTRRVIRALEVIEITGSKFSEPGAWGRFDSRYALAAAGLTRPRPELAARIEHRVAQMLARGLLSETEALLARGMSRTARQALGYRQIIERDGDLERSIAKATRRFARRQESWFRGDPRVTWFDAAGADVAAALGALFAGRLALRSRR